MLLRSPVLLALALMLLVIIGGGRASAGLLSADFVVNVEGDQSDLDIGINGCDASLAVGSQCTLRAAIQEANASAALSAEITFAIPNPGLHTITLGSPLPPLTKRASIDGYTQPGAVKNTLGPGGGTNAQLMVRVDLGNLAALQDAITLQADGSTIKGLIINHSPADATAIKVVSDNNKIQGNFLGIDSTGTTFSSVGNGVWIQNHAGNVVGGTNAADRNLITSRFANSNGAGNGILIATGEDNSVHGNIIGADRTGTVPLSDGNGIRVSQGSTNNTIGGSTPQARNVISGNQFGILVSEPSTTDNVIAGNFIGTQSDGVTALSNLIGIWVLHGGATLIGDLAVYNGACTGACNVISGNATGIEVFDGDDVRIQSNHIGVDIIGGPLANNLDGILLREGTTHSFIQSNVIAYNDSGIIARSSAGTGNYFALNMIFSNERRGIDLSKEDSADGVTPNDPLDADVGPNDFFNFPVLTSATPGSTNISGSYHGLPNKNIGIEYFSNDQCDFSGNGEGQHHLGFAYITTDPGGDVSFALSIAETAPPGSFITSTAFSPTQFGGTGDTSEFSNCVQMPGPPVTPTPTPPVGPTPTPTATPVGQTPTPTPIGQTPTPTATPTPVGQTPTPTPTGGPQQNATWADDDCNGAVAATDALKKLQDIASLPYNVEPGCPTLGDVVGVQPAGPQQLLWGDTDCDADYDAVDALQILRSIAAFSVNQTQPCPAIGDPVLILE